MVNRRSGLMIAAIITALVFLLAPTALAGSADTGWINAYWQIYGGTYADARARIVTDGSTATAAGYWLRHSGINTIDYFAVATSVQKNGVTQASATCDRTYQFNHDQTAGCNKSVAYSSGSWRSRTFACADDGLFSYRCSYDYVGHLYSPTTS